MRTASFSLLLALWYGTSSAFLARPPPHFEYCFPRQSIQRRLLVESRAAWKEWGLHWNRGGNSESLSAEEVGVAITDGTTANNHQHNATTAHDSTIRGLEKMQTEIGALIQELQNKRDSNGKEAVLQAKLASLSYDLEAYRKTEADKRVHKKAQSFIDNRTSSVVNGDNEKRQLVQEMNQSDKAHELNGSTTTSEDNVANKFFAQHTKDSESLHHSSQSDNAATDDEYSTSKQSKGIKKKLRKQKRTRDIKQQSSDQEETHHTATGARLPPKIQTVMAKKIQMMDTPSRGAMSELTWRATRAPKMAMNVFQIGKDRSRIPVVVMGQQKRDTAQRVNGEETPFPNVTLGGESSKAKASRSSNYIMEIKEESLGDNTGRFGSEPRPRRNIESPLLKVKGEKGSPGDERINGEAVPRGSERSSTENGHRFGEPPRPVSGSQTSFKKPVSRPHPVGSNAASESSAGKPQDDEPSPPRRRRKHPPRPVTGPPRQRRFGEPPMSMFESGHTEMAGVPSQPRFDPIAPRGAVPPPMDDFDFDPLAGSSQQNPPFADGREARPHSPDTELRPQNSGSAAREVRRFARIHSPDRPAFADMPRPELRDEHRNTVYRRVRRASSLEPEWLQDQAYAPHHTHFDVGMPETQYRTRTRTESFKNHVRPDFMEGEFQPRAATWPRARAQPMTRTRRPNIMDNVIDATIEKIEEIKKEEVVEETKETPEEATQTLDAPPTDIWDTPFPIRIDGDELRTWSFQDTSIERVQVFLKADGDKPLHANVDLWHGPDDTPQKMTVFVKEGGSSPFSAVMETPVGQNSVAIRNSGKLGNFLRAAVVASDFGNGSHGFGPLAKKLANLEPEEKYMEGGAKKLFPVSSNWNSVQVLLRTFGFPLHARVEVVDKENHLSQLIEIYTEDGLRRPFFIVIETPGEENVVRVVNTGPEGFPLEALMEPHMDSNA